MKGKQHPSLSLALVPDSLGGLGLHACFLPAPAYPHGDPQHMVIFVQLAQRWVFFTAITGAFIKHFMYVDRFSFSKHFHWTLFTRSKNCHGSIEVSRGKLTHVSRDLS